ncbi:hypothetical protein EDD18DRAFT_1433393 [Armillaria luteobubalina]|uniref:F-box domain-containing protein n=1 Tax=Armillaria luteobubalina TaxID=153913 RepID=A0AA39PF12_9AGAR|nr:hypothetical protein EDD18DRAFT_1433393 [Armillaria luteobubalina]
MGICHAGLVIPYPQSLSVVTTLTPNRKEMLGDANDNQTILLDIIRMSLEATPDHVSLQLDRNQRKMGSEADVNPTRKREVDVDGTWSETWCTIRSFHDMSASHRLLHVPLLSSTPLRPPHTQSPPQNGRTKGQGRSWNQERIEGKRQRRHARRDETENVRCTLLRTSLRDSIEGERNSGMLKEFDVPQELVNCIIDELKNDHATLTKLLLVSRSFRESLAPPLPASPIPLSVQSLHVHPFNPPLNDILPLLRNASHVHLQTASRDVLWSTGLA